MKAMRQTEALVKVQLSATDRHWLRRLLPTRQRLSPKFGNKDYSKIVVNKPWGYEYLIYGNPEAAAWILHLRQSHQTSLHCHPRKKTSLSVLSGEVLCSFLTGKKRLQAGQSVIIDKGVFHSTKALSPGGAFVMEVETPVDKHDLVRFRDKYGRQHLGYERQSADARRNYNYISLIDPAAYFNVKKHFGEGSIVFRKYRSGELLRDALQKEDAVDSFTVLRGEIVGASAQTLLGVGDAAPISLLAQNRDCRAQGDLEMVLIRSRDADSRLSDYVVSLLESRGLTEFFAVPGSTNVNLLDSVGRNTAVNCLFTQSEKAAAMAAEAYAKLTRKPGVLIVSSGACAIDVLPAVASAWTDSTPLLIISGHCQKDLSLGGTGLRQLGNQEADMAALAKPITKRAILVSNAYDIRYEIEKALHLASEGRPGPVWIDIPTDLLGMLVNIQEMRAFHAPRPRPRGGASMLGRSAAAALRMLQRADRPVLIGGSGIRIDGAEDLFQELADKLRIPVLLSRRGADLLPADHPLFFGRPGAYGQRAANFTVQNADLLLCIGNRMSLPQIGRNYKLFAREAKIVAVDIDPAELRKKTVHVDLPIVSTASAFMENLLSHAIETRWNSDSAKLKGWRARCANWRKTFWEPERKSSAAGLNAYVFMDALSRELPEDSVVSFDCGNLSVFVMQSMRCKRGQRLISSTGLENGAFAVPAAIGAAIGTRGKSHGVVCLCEDRSLLANVPELETLRRYNLPVKVFVLTGGRSYIRNIQRDYFGGRLVGSDAPEQGVNCERVARAFGLPVTRLRPGQDTIASIRRFLQSPGPALCAVQIDPNQEIIPRMAYKVTTDGRWEARPLEDMYPYLSREALGRQMVISVAKNGGPPE